MPHSCAIHRARGHVRMIRHIRNAVKAAVFIGINPFPGMLVRLPGTVGRRIVHAEIEGLPAFRQGFQIPAGALCDQVCDILAMAHADFPVFHDIRMIVETSALAKGIPGSEPVLGMYAVPQMPFSAERACITGFCQHIRIAGHAFQIGNGLRFIRIPAVRVFPALGCKLPRIHIPRADPVQNAVCARHTPGEQ